MKFKEAEALTGVAQFHKTFDLPIVDKPGIPSKERCELRISLLEEELRELKTAIANGDIVEAADAFSDLQYVLSGAILEFGLGEKFKELFDEVQRSNMSKTCKSMEEAEATQSYYEMHRGMSSVIKEKDGEFLVYRESDGKVFKSVNYSPPDLENIVNR